MGEPCQTSREAGSQVRMAGDSQPVVWTKGSLLCLLGRSPAKGSRQWKPCLAGVGLPQFACWPGQGRGKPQKGSFGESRALVSEPSSRAWSTTHPALGSVPGAHSCPVVGSFYPWFNSRFELQANAKCRRCSSVQILRCPLPPQIIQLPHGHSNLSCIKSLWWGESPFCKGLLLLIWGLYRRAGFCQWRELRNTLNHQVPEAGTTGCMNPSITSPRS